MTTEEIKKHFKMFPCPNPIHEFEYGSFMGQWQIAEEYWSQIVDKTRQDIWFGVYRLNTIQGLVGHVIIIWKLKIIFGWAK